MSRQIPKNTVWISAELKGSCYAEERYCNSFSFTEKDMIEHFWNDPKTYLCIAFDKGGYRNWFGIYPNENDADYIAIKSLVEKGYMQKDGLTNWNEEVYSVTNKGNAYVVDLWYKKKKENKPIRA